LNHWTEKYLGQPWTQERNCYYWFRRIMAEEFGHTDLPPVVVAPEDGVTRLAAREFTDEAVRRYGWERVEGLAREGDAAYLTQGKNYNTHIGVVFFINGKQFILHARRGVGVVASDRQGLSLNFLRERGYWRHASAL